MSLQKQTIAVDFTGGVDTKTATQSIMPGSFLIIENAVRRRTKLITKRFGFSALSTDVSDGSSITQGRRIARFNDELDLIDNNHIFSYIPSATEWVNRGKVSSVLVDAKPLIRNSSTQAMPDMACANGLTCTVYEDSRGGVRYSISDDASGAVSVYDQVLHATGDRPKVVAIGNRFILLYRDGTALKSRYINTANPTVITSAVTVINTLADQPWDICANNSTSAVFAVNNGTTITLGYIDNNGVLGSPGLNGLPNPINLAERGRDCVTILCDTTYFYVVYCDNADFAGLHVTAITPDFLSQNTATIAGIDTRNVTIVKNATGEYEVYYEDHQVSEFLRQFIKTYTRRFTYDGATFTFTTAHSLFKSSMGLISKAFLVDDFVYVNLTHQSELQSTYLTVRSDGFISARFSAGVGGGLTKDPTGAYESGLCAAPLNSMGNHVISTQIANKLIADNDGHIKSEYLGLNLISLSIDQSDLIADELGRNLHIAGGVLSSYDGAQTVESGFHFYPENIVLTAKPGATFLTPGAYQVRVLYEWVDGQGNIHQSAPSIAQSVTVSSGEFIEVLAPYLTMTEKTDVKIVIYRTLVNGESVFYRDLVADNVPTQDYSFFNLNRADAVVGTQEILYTTGGNLENIAPPSNRIVHKHKNRLFLAGLEDGNSIAYSKQYDPGTGIGFSDGFVFQVDPLGGDVTALTSLEDKLVMFKKDRLFIMGGDGPLDTGAQNDYPLPKLISGDVGCDNQDSIAIMPEGVMFKSNKGIYLLNSATGLEYVGAPVESYNNLIITSAVFIENTNEVRFTTSDGVALVYNYFFKQWSTFTNYTASSALAVLGSYAHLKPNGIVNVETPDTYLDNGQKIKIRLETSWFNFAGIQSFQRIYRYALLGDFLTHCTTRVKLAYNYEPVYNETVYFNSQTGLMQSVYGDDTTYGDSTVYGGTGSLVYQFRSKPARQKCEAIKLQIEVLDNIESLGGPCVALTNLSFDVGVKGEINRMGGGKNVGSL